PRPQETLAKQEASTHVMAYKMPLVGASTASVQDALMAARYRGVRTVEYDGKRVTYASDGEMAAALADLNGQIAGATDRISVVRIQSSKGL
ncbi:hypothetical protein LV82_02975, partial [Albidovulum inexpectatum]